MAQIRWTTQSADDLESIAEYIAYDSPHYASLFAINILDSVERLSLFPLLGRKVPETSDDSIRELLLGNYRIIYRNRPDIVEVYHGSRLLDPAKLK